MKDSERDDFEKDPLFEKSLKLREYDDRAKIVGKVVPDLNHYKTLLKILENLWMPLIFDFTSEVTVINRDYGNQAFVKIMH